MTAVLSGKRGRWSLVVGGVVLAAALVAAVVTSSGPTAAAPWSPAPWSPAPRQVAPYVDVTGALPADPGSLVGPSGPGDAVLAFVLAGDGGCTPSWGGTVPLDDPAVAGVVNDLPADRLGAGFSLVELDEALKLVGDDVQVLDVRMPSELEQVRLSGAVERFVPEVFTLGVPEQLDPTSTVLVACASGRRASIAASRLVAAGFTDVRVLTGAGVPDLVSAA